MKSTFALLLGAAVLAAGLAGCGQTGPLYMPKAPAKPVTPPPPPDANAPVPPPSLPAPAPQQ